MVRLRHNVGGRVIPPLQQNIYPIVYFLQFFGMIKVNMKSEKDFMGFGPEDGKDTAEEVDRRIKEKKLGTSIPTLGEALKYGWNPHFPDIEDDSLKFYLRQEEKNKWSLTDLGKKLSITELTKLARKRGYVQEALRECENQALFGGPESKVIALKQESVAKEMIMNTDRILELSADKIARFLDYQTIKEVEKCLGEPLIDEYFFNKHSGLLGRIPKIGKWRRLKMARENVRDRMGWDPQYRGEIAARLLLTQAAKSKGKIRKNS